MTRWEMFKLAAWRTRSDRANTMRSVFCTALVSGWLYGLLGWEAIGFILFSVTCFYIDTANGFAAGGLYELEQVDTDPYFMHRALVAQLNADPVDLEKTSPGGP